VVGLSRADHAAEAAAESEEYIRADLTETNVVTAALDAVRPEVVFHLAASPAFKQAGPASVTKLVNDAVAGTFSLMSAVASIARRPLVVLAGSSAQYGALPIEENPVTEDSRCNPITPYGWAKAAAEATARAFAAGGSVEILPVRVFNLIGPGEPPTTVASAFAARIVAVLDGRSDEVQARDLSTVRDFSDVRDIAAGYVDIAERGTPGHLYNLCSGRATTVGDLLDGLLAAAGLDRGVVRVLPDSGPGNVAYQVGSPSRVGAEVGWSTTIERSRSLGDLLAHIQQDLAR
jgi:GDP-4-dehydro-6-deoxy-D-mannose reductase